MNKDKPGKSVGFKKSLVRNTVQTNPKTVVIQEPEVEPGPSSVSLKAPGKQNAAPERLASRKPTFESPELNSALRLARKIESVENVRPRKVKSVSDLEKKKQLVIDERAAKQVNFPYNQHIYKDLIPLCVKTQPQILPSVSREVMVQRDKEPVLSDFYTPSTLPEYTFQVPVQPHRRTLNREFDGFKLYRTIINWN